MNAIFAHLKKHPFYGITYLVVCLLLLISYIVYYSYYIAEPVQNKVTPTEDKISHTKTFITEQLKDKATHIESSNASKAQTESATPNTHSLKITLPDFSSYRSITNRKRAFFDFLMPLAQATNAEVLAIRQELQTMKVNDLSQPQKKRIAELARTYKVTYQSESESVEVLLKKIRPIPTALTLAQAASESGWGTSRFAVQGNNLFGQWCFKQGCGIIPKQRNSDSRHEVKVFDTPKESVAAYVKNLNSHSGYQNLRNIRHCLINQNQPVTGRDLAYGLVNYSSRGMEYVNEIKTIIKQNKLEPWSKNWWANNNTNPCSQWIDIDKVSVH